MQPFFLQHPRRRQAQEHVGARQHVRQDLRIRVAGITRHVGQHAFAVRADHTLDVGQRDVLDLQPHRDQQVNAGQSRRAGTGGHQLRLRQRLALQQQPIAYGSGDGDGGAVLVVVEDRDFHPLAELGLNRETLRRLDVFEVDGPEGRLQRGDHVAEFRGIEDIDLNIEDVDAGEFLEQDGLALHHRLAGQGADIAQAEHGGAVGDHRHQITARGIIIGRIGIGHDRLTRRGDAGGVGEREVALRRHLLGGLDRQFPGARQPVIVQRGFAKVLVHGGVWPCLCWPQHGGAWGGWQRFVWGGRRVGSVPEQGDEAIDREARVRDDVAQRPEPDLPMIGNDNAGVGIVASHNHMASRLTPDRKAGPFKGRANLSAGQIGW